MLFETYLKLSVMLTKLNEMSCSTLSEKWLVKLLFD